MVKTFILVISSSILLSCSSRPIAHKTLDNKISLLDKVKLKEFLCEIMDGDQKYRGMIRNLNSADLNYEVVRDSLWSLQEEIDDQNTRKLIAFTKEYGFPYPTRTGIPEPVWLIFHHANEKYHQDIKPLLQKELEAQRIGKAEYSLILWNVNGRTGQPFSFN